ncbi:MAG: hypothetical protein K2Y27_10815 [Xanthobacteraceae bacterium]|nr:hypothetical protein [Xanthobacteraceae bacterium]
MSTVSAARRGPVRFTKLLLCPERRKVQIRKTGALLSDSMPACGLVEDDRQPVSRALRTFNVADL